MPILSNMKDFLVWFVFYYLSTVHLFPSQAEQQYNTIPNPDSFYLQQWAAYKHMSAFHHDDQKYSEHRVIRNTWQPQGHN